MKRLPIAWALLALVAAPLLMINRAEAQTVADKSANIHVIAAPPSVVDGALESNTAVFAFQERQSVLLASDLQVSTGLNRPDLAVSGKRVNSFLLHFDPVGPNEVPISPINYQGFIQFDQRVVGLIFLAGTDLGPSDALFANPTTVYSNNENPLGGSYETSPFGVSFSFNQSDKAVLRVITEAAEGDLVPEPGALILFAPVLGVLVLARGARRRFSVEISGSGR